ncbi:phosphoribosylanthranilate isomerase [Thermodesulfobacteriota bacterium]
MIENDSPQVKICGLTKVDEALECAALGAHAIGCVFFPKSPRNVTEAQAREICMALPKKVVKVGVFVNETFDKIMKKVEQCALTAIQLHGQESPTLVKRLREGKLIVIKALFSERQPAFEEASNYEASAFLLECGKGALPGGNAIQWNWDKTLGFGRRYPFMLAGGLAPDNVAEAIASGSPDVVDVSSGVETSPGRKDPAKVRAFMETVHRCKVEKRLRRIF